MTYRFTVRTSIVARIVACLGGALFLLLSSSAYGVSREPIRDVHTISPADFRCTHECIATVSIQDKTFLAAEWPRGETLALRTYNGAWSDWEMGSDEIDQPDGTAQRHSHIFPVGSARRIEIRMSERPSTEIVLTAFSLPPSMKRMSVRASTDTPSGPLIISRLQWLDAGIELSESERNRLWQSTYTPIEKFIVHHTATSVRDITNDGIIDQRDYRESIRSIYYYHSQINKWGDIGYQYIIDPDGTIWEGRFGGDGVVGGHAWRDRGCSRFQSTNVGFNEGTIGIALLGSFQDSGMTPAAREALTSLIAHKSWSFYVQPGGSGFFKDQVYPNVVGHRDVDCTACPGNQVYATLSELATLAQQKTDILLATSPRTYRAEVVQSSETVMIGSEKKKTVTISVRNTGSMSWRGYGPTPVALASADIKKHSASLDQVVIAVEAPKADILPGLLSGKLISPNVAPGEIGLFELTVTPSPTEYKTTQSFVVALGTRGWMSGADVEIAVINTQLDYAATSEVEAIPRQFLDGTPVKSSISFINQGTKTWKRGEVQLKIMAENDTRSSLYDTTWPKEDGAFQFKEANVAPGEIATFAFTINAATPGLIQEKVILLRKGVPISGSDYERFTGIVSPAYAYEITSMAIPSAILSTWRPSVTVTVKNTGALPWSGAQLTSLQKGKKSLFHSPTWVSGVVIDKTRVVKPGESVTFIFKIKPPTKPGTYPLELALQQKGRRFFVTHSEGYRKSMTVSIRVDAPQTAVKKKK